VFTAKPLAPRTWAGAAILRADCRPAAALAGVAGSALCDRLRRSRPAQSM